eukprot:gene4248-8444_t
MAASSPLTKIYPECCPSFDGLYLGTPPEKTTLDIINQSKENVKNSVVVTQLNAPFKNRTSVTDDLVNSTRVTLLQTVTNGQQLDFTKCLSSDAFPACSGVRNSSSDNQERLMPFSIKNKNISYTKNKISMSTKTENTPSQQMFSSPKRKSYCDLYDLRHAKKAKSPLPQISGASKFVIGSPDPLSKYYIPPPKDAFTANDRYARIPLGEISLVSSVERLDISDGGESACFCLSPQMTMTAFVTANHDHGDGDDQNAADDDDILLSASPLPLPVNLYPTDNDQGIYSESITVPNVVQTDVVITAPSLKTFGTQRGEGGMGGGMNMVLATERLPDVNSKNKGTTMPTILVPSPSDDDSPTSVASRHLMRMLSPSPSPEYLKVTSGVNSFQQRATIRCDGDEGGDVGDDENITRNGLGLAWEEEGGEYDQTPPCTLATRQASCIEMHSTHVQEGSLYCATILSCKAPVFPTTDLVDVPVSSPNPIPLHGTEIIGIAASVGGDDDGPVMNMNMQPRRPSERPFQSGTTGESMSRQKHRRRMILKSTAPLETTTTSTSSTSTPSEGEDKKSDDNIADCTPGISLSLSSSDGSIQSTGRENRAALSDSDKGEYGSSGRGSVRTTHCGERLLSRPKPKKFRRRKLNRKRGNGRFSSVLESLREGVSESLPYPEWLYSIARELSQTQCCSVKAISIIDNDTDPTVSLSLDSIDSKSTDYIAGNNDSLGVSLQSSSSSSSSPFDVQVLMLQRKSLDTVVTADSSPSGLRPALTLAPIQKRSPFTFQKDDNYSQLLSRQCPHVWMCPENNNKSSSNSNSSSAGAAFSAVLHKDLQALKDFHSHQQDRVWLSERESVFGNSLLVVAAQMGWRKGVKFLMKKGADLNLQNQAGNTALHFADAFGHTDVVQFLLKHGADTNIKNSIGLLSDERPKKLLDL